MHEMKIAHLVMAHKDIPHIIRLTEVLKTFSDVYIHLDKNTDGKELFSSFKHDEKVFCLNGRLHPEWGGLAAVEAEIALIREALHHGNYDRLVFLQGADYPIKSGKYMERFFEDNCEVEFIRGCDCTDSKNPYFWNRCYCVHFRNNANFIKKMYNKLCYELKINMRFRKGYIEDNGIYKVYWGSAQWAITGECAKFIIDFHDSHPAFNKWFYYAFPADELYFPTVIMNSEWADKTSYHGAEPEKEGLVNWRNLHYFEYPQEIRVFKEKDFDFVKHLDELYIRKVNTEQSTGLLDKIDKYILEIQ